MPTEPSAPSRPALLSRLGIDDVWIQGDLSSRLFLALRWIAILGQAAVLLVSHRLGIEIPWLIALSALFLALTTNVALEWWKRSFNSELGHAIFHVALWDIFILTLLLYRTGGMDNPFAVFFLVQLTVAIVSLRVEGIAILSGITLLACVFLWTSHQPLMLRDGSPVNASTMALGRLVAMVLAGGTILTLLVAIRRRSFLLQEEQEKLRQELEEQDRFLSVAALATGFAHELATPLGTISITAEEMKPDPDGALHRIRREATRCVDVLDQLRSVGQEAVEMSSPPQAVEKVVEDVIQRLTEPQQQRIKLDLHVLETRIRCSGLREALLVILRNALEFSLGNGVVEMKVTESSDAVTFTVADRGTGFDPETLRHLGEPFHSTRKEGLGLGLFFVRRLVSVLEGSVEFENRSEGGAMVRLVIPARPERHEISTLH